MAVILGKVGLVRQLNEAMRQLQAVRRSIQSIYRDAEQREKDGYSPATVQNEMQARLDEIEDAVDIVATDLTALVFTYQTRAKAGMPMRSAALEVITDPYHDASVNGGAVIQPADVYSTWYVAGVDQPFQDGDYIEISGSENAANDGVYEVAEIADETVDGTNYVYQGNFSSDTKWTLGANWAIASNKATHTVGDTADLSQAHTDMATEPTALGLYMITFTVSSMTAGSVTAKVGNNGAQQAIITTDDIDEDGGGTFTFCASYSSTYGLVFTPTTDFDGDISAVDLRPLRGIALTEALDTNNDDDESMVLTLRQR